jgi:hypothetical protein
MSAPLRRVLLRSPSATGDFAAADWRSPDVALLARQHGRTAAAGCEVHAYPGSEISLKGDGGPTCLTAPIWRCPDRNAVTDSR